jgi:hypothetical protein
LVDRSRRKPMIPDNVLNMVKNNQGIFIVDWNSLMESYSFPETFINKYLGNLNTPTLMATCELSTKFIVDNFRNYDYLNVVKYQDLDSEFYEYLFLHARKNTREYTGNYHIDRNDANPLEFPSFLRDSIVYQDKLTPNLLAKYVRTLYRKEEFWSLCQSYQRFSEDYIIENLDQFNLEILRKNKNIPKDVFVRIELLKAIL